MPVVPPEALEAAPGPLEAKIAAEIEELAGLSPWTTECARLEEQSLIASRIVDQCMASGRLHLTTPQHRVIRDALADLRRLLAPVAASGRVLTPAEVEAEDFVAALTPLGDPSLVHRHAPGEECRACIGTLQV